MLITISGLPGSGTTTVSRLVATALHLDRVPGGEVFRQLAAESGMSLAEFGEHAQHHPDIDRELDDRLEARAREGSCVIESRLAGWLAARADLLAVRVWIDCDEAVRAARVAERDGTSPEQSRRDNAERAALERARYLAAYDIDLDDRTPYDLLLDSTSESADTLAHTVITRARAVFP
ncbi:MAG: (d)CMP kinase [Acidimicrobiales bacterium]